MAKTTTVKASASTLPTRQRTLPKNKANGARKAIAPVEEQEEVEEVDLSGAGDEGEGGDDGQQQIDEDADGEPLAASDADEAPPEPEVPARRGRPKGPRKTAVATKSGGDIYTTLCQAGLSIKQIADDHGKTPDEILTAVGKMIAATASFDI